MNRRKVFLLMLLPKKIRARFVRRYVWRNRKAA